MQAGAKTPRSEGRAFEKSCRNGLRSRSPCFSILFDYFYALERIRSLSMSSSPSKFHALVENDRGYVKVSLEYVGGIKKLRLSLEWLTDERHFPQKSGSFSWRIERSGTRQDLAQFNRASDLHCRSLVIRRPQAKSRTAKISVPRVPNAAIYSSYLQSSRFQRNYGLSVPSFDACCRRR